MLSGNCEMPILSRATDAFGDSRERTKFCSDLGDTLGRDVYRIVTSKPQRLDDSTAIVALTLEGDPPSGEPSQIDMRCTLVAGRSTWLIDDITYTGKPN